MPASASELLLIGAEEGRVPRPAAVVACPLSMNSASKAATGIMDTYSAGVLCDALAMRSPSLSSSR